MKRDRLLSAASFRLGFDLYAAGAVFLGAWGSEVFTGRADLAILVEMVRRGLEAGILTSRVKLATYVSIFRVPTL